MNKFEQVSSDYHQLSVAEVDIPGPRSRGVGILGPMSGGWVSQVPCAVGEYPTM